MPKEQLIKARANSKALLAQDGGGGRRPMIPGLPQEAAEGCPLTRNRQRRSSCLRHGRRPRH